jgi:hypothetical protein
VQIVIVGSFATSNRQSKEELQAVCLQNQISKNGCCMDIGHRKEHQRQAHSYSAVWVHKPARPPVALVIEEVPAYRKLVICERKRRRQR